MSAAWPHVVNWLVSEVPQMVGWGAQVFDGAPVSGDDPTDYFTVGWTSSGDTGGEFVSVESEDGFGESETGHVLCDLTCQTGDDALSEVRIRAAGYVDVLRAQIKKDRTLGGVLSPNATVGLTITPLDVSNQAGVAVSMLITFAYTTTVWD